MSGRGRVLWATIAACAAVAVAGCQQGGPVAHRQVINYALVSPTGRVVTVPAPGCGVVRLTLTATEIRSTVRLRSVGYSWPGSGVACFPPAPHVHASIRLRTPLGGRALVDAATGHRVPVITATSLAQPGWLPAGARGPQNSPVEGWTRTYNFPTRNDRGLLLIVENPRSFANPQEFSAQLGQLTHLTVAGHPATLLVQRRDGAIVEDEIGWHAGGYALIVKSTPLAAGRRPFSPSVLKRVAASLSDPPTTN